MISETSFLFRLMFSERLLQMSLSHILLHPELFQEKPRERADRHSSARRQDLPVPDLMTDMPQVAVAADTVVTSNGRSILLSFSNPFSLSLLVPQRTMLFY